MVLKLHIELCVATKETTSENESVRQAMSVGIQ